MKDESFAKVFKLKKYKDLFDFTSIECVVALISMIVFEIIIIIWRGSQNCNEIVMAMSSILDGLSMAFIGFLGFIVTGLAILTGAISSKIVKRLLESGKMDALERILLSFYLLGMVSAFIIVISLVLHFIIELPFDTNLVAVMVISAIYAYFVVFSIFYAVKLIGNCLELFFIINEMQIIAEDDTLKYKNLQYKIKYDAYRIMVLEKLVLSTTSQDALSNYRNGIYDLICEDDTDENEKKIYIEMLKTQFGEKDNENV